MQAKKFCLVLAAGFGTRMGEIGKSLPKVMWPVFEMSLLELQVRFARKLGYPNVYINLHHQADEILRRSNGREAFKGVTWLKEEPEILDIGGGIHNLASRPEVQYQGELLVLNADQFLWFTADDLEQWKAGFSDWDSILLTWGVNSSQGYNQVGTDENLRFTGVIQNSLIPRDTAIETYSGNSLIRLDRLEKSTGPSAFFKSVCPPTQKVMTARLREGRYWDFGTAQRYISSMRGALDLLIKHSEDEFVRFLADEGGIDRSKINGSKHSYGCNVEGVINLGNDLVPESHPPGIILSGKAVGTGLTDTLVFDGIVQPLS